MAAAKLAEGRVSQIPTTKMYMPMIPELRDQRNAPDVSSARGASDA